MITLEHVYLFAGLVFALIAVLNLRDGENPKRFGNAAFWGLFAASFLFGSRLGNVGNGILVLGLVALGGSGALGSSRVQCTTPAEREERARQRGNLLFVPALIVPLIALAGTYLFKSLSAHGVALVDAKQATLISLALGVIVALAVAMLWLKPPLLAPFEEGCRLLGSIGWAALLPQMLASLGAVFALAGVGHAVGRLAADYMPLDQPFVAVVAYCCGMALFTIVMGNAFAAFPVMTAAIGVPVIVHKFGGNPAIMGAIGMLAGFCGTLVTPMAANFNIVPAALLDLPDRYGVIKVQYPTAAILFVVNTLLMYFLVYGGHRP